MRRNPVAGAQFGALGAPGVGCRHPALDYRDLGPFMLAQYAERGAQHFDLQRAGIDPQRAPGLAPHRQLRLSLLQGQLPRTEMPSDVQPGTAVEQGLTAVGQRHRQALLAAGMGLMAIGRVQPEQGRARQQKHQRSQQRLARTSRRARRGQCKALLQFLAVLL